MDQPAPEVLRLERMLDAYAKWEDRETKKSETRNKNRSRHEHIKVTDE